MIRQPSIRLLVFSLIGALTCALPETAPAQVIKTGPPSCPGIALTFDLCPVRKGAGYDKALMDYLIEHRIPATLFMSGKWMATHEQEVRNLVDIGLFEIGTHGNIHAHLPVHDAQAQRDEILGPVTILRKRYAHKTSLFRPPYGEYKDVTVQVVKALGLQFIQWNIESGDPDPALSTEQILTRVTQRAKPGSIIVFHANGKGKHTREVIAQLTHDVFPRKALTPMTVSDLLNCKPPAL